MRVHRNRYSLDAHKQTTAACLISESGNASESSLRSPPQAKC
jgi:hypothetical protein